MITLVRAHPPQSPMVQLADLVLRFGRVNRATLHPDGLRPESDTDHTVMLGLLAVAIARAHPELGLDVGLVAQLALVHDLPEALCGDVNTMGGLTPEKRRAKEIAELEAGEEIYRRFVGGPLHAVAELLVKYELAVRREVRFIRYLDKITPKLTHALNQGAAVAAQGVTPDELHAMHERQRAELRDRYPELADVLDPILAEACAGSEAAYREDNVTDLVTWPAEGGWTQSGLPPTACTLDSIMRDLATVNHEEALRYQGAAAMHDHIETIFRERSEWLTREVLAGGTCDVERDQATYAANKIRALDPVAVLRGSP